MRKIEKEKWKVLAFYKNAFGKHYAISNHGRLVSLIKNRVTGYSLKVRYRRVTPSGVFVKRKKTEPLFTTEYCCTV